jgi:hypothetical protein
MRQERSSTLMPAETYNNVMSFAIVFMGYLRGIWRYLRFLLITAVDFYYVINKLIILLYDSH